MFKQVLLFLLPAMAIGHACTPFNVTSPDDEALGGFRINMLFPGGLVDFIDANANDTYVYGNFDCHAVKEGATNGTENEVGVAAACTGTGDCECFVMYDFMPCKSCMLACGTDSSTLTFTKEDVVADCSNVFKEGQSVSDQCMVGCGYETVGCFVDDPKPDESSSIVLSGVAGAAVMAVMALFS